MFSVYIILHDTWFLHAFIYNQGHLIATIESLAWRNFKGRKPFESLQQIMHVTLLFPTELTGRVMFVDVEWFLRGHWTLLSFTAHSTELFSVLTARVKKVHTDKIKQGHIKHHVWQSQKKSDPRAGLSLENLNLFIKTKPIKILKIF